MLNVRAAQNTSSRIVRTLPAGYQFNATRICRNGENVNGYTTWAEVDVALAGYLWPTRHRSRLLLQHLNVWQQAVAIVSSTPLIYAMRQAHRLQSLVAMHQASHLTMIATSTQTVIVGIAISVIVANARYVAKVD